MCPGDALNAKKFMFSRRLKDFRRSPATPENHPSAVGLSHPVPSPSVCSTRAGTSPSPTYRVPRDRLLARPDGRVGSSLRDLSAYGLATRGVIQAPGARVHGQPELAGHRQRRDVVPGRAVKGNSARRPHRERPCGRHAGSESVAAECRRRFQPSLRSKRGFPRRAAGAYGAFVALDCCDRCPTLHFVRSPIGKVRQEPADVVRKNHTCWFGQRVGEVERRTCRHLPADERAVSSRIHGRRSKVGRWWLVRGQFFKFVLNLLWRVASHRPNAPVAATGDPEHGPVDSVRFPCTDDQTFIVEPKQRLHVQPRRGYRIHRTLATALDVIGSLKSPVIADATSLERHPCRD